jgi:hypothetical protein
VHIEYRYRCDADYFRAVLDRQYQQGPLLLRLPVQFGLLGAACALCTVMAFGMSLAQGVASFFIITFLVMAAGGWATKQGLMMKFKRKAGFGSEVSVSLTHAGLDIKTGVSSVRADWAAYPNAIRFRDGILLKNQRSIRWLPDAAILIGSPSDSTNLVGLKTALRVIQ